KPCIIMRNGHFALFRDLKERYMLARIKYSKYLECIFYIFLAVVLIKNHYLFLRYAVNLHVLAGINFGELVFNVLYTPVLLLLFLLSFWGYGRKIVNVFCKDALLTEYEHVISIALGMGIFNLIMLIFGFLKALMLPVLLAVLLTGIGFFLHEIICIKKSFSFKQFRLPDALYKRIFFTIIAAALTFGIMEALSPPISRDALYCHLSVAYKYAVSKGIVPDPTINLMSCLVGMEMLTASALMLKNDLLAQLLPLASEGILLLAVFIFARKRYSILVAWASAAFLSVMPTTLYLSGIVNNDMYSVCSSFLAVVFFLEFMKGRQPKYLMLVGAFCGLSSGAKITGIIASSWIGLVIAVLVIQRKSKFAVSDISLHYFHNFYFAAVWKEFLSVR
ncbi:MAG: glycosyltransferase family 39 protein, partial [bacterium]